MRTEAIGYARAGLEVFPVKPDKTPYVSQHQATTDPEQVAAWWDRWPEASIGHRLDGRTVILDVDPRHGGHDTWKALRAELGDITTRVHYSGRDDGGGHIWLERPGGELSVTRLDAWAKGRGLGRQVRARWSSGIDLITREHRYTILPPSIHAKSGKPYRWADGRGLDLQPVAMPAGLAELVARDEIPRADDHDGFRQADSIADWFSDTHGFGPLLSPHGWTLVRGDGEADGSLWRHPTATAAHSASVSNGCLFVHSPNTPFEQREPGDAHGYTPFRAWAVLEHGGDLAAAASAARRMKGPDVSDGLTPNRSNGASDTSGTRESPSDAERLAQLERFWGARPALSHIRDFARARRCSPWALLGVVLARVAAATPPFAVLPPLVGSWLSLNFYVVLVGGSGAGKDAAISAGVDCIDLHAGIDFREVGLGSGEGMLDQYVTYRQPNARTNDPGGIEQHNVSVLFTNSEIETLGALKGRSGSTLMPELRNAWTGRTLGFAYANRERRLSVPSHAYRLALVLGAQPSKCGILLDDHAAGTPQRFVWLPASDPNAPNDAPQSPDAWGWALPTWPTAVGGRAEVGVCAEVARTVHATRLTRLKGDGSDGGLDGHAVACREKVAALLAILDQRAEVGIEDWVLAGIVAQVSDATRAHALEVIRVEKRDANATRGQAEGERKVIVNDTEADRVIQRISPRLLAHLSHGRWESHSKLKGRLAHRDREHFEDAIDRLTGAAMVESDEGEYHGQAVRRYRRLAMDTRTMSRAQGRTAEKALRESPGE